jgi:hypothetical protein
MAISSSIPSSIIGISALDEQHRHDHPAQTVSGCPPDGSSLHVGLVPPSAVRIEDLPDCLAQLLAYLRESRNEDDVVAFLAGHGIEAAAAMDLVNQLTDAELVSTPIPATGRYARHLLYFDSIGADHNAAQSRINGRRYRHRRRRLECRYHARHRQSWPHQAHRWRHDRAI